MALFGPEGADFGGEQAALGPESPLIETTVPGEYHIFTRAITVAQQECRFEVSVR